MPELTLPGLMDQIQAVDERTRPRVSIQEMAFEADKIGDEMIVRMVTGVIVNTGSTTIYLTVNRERHGTSLFAKRPTIVEIAGNGTTGSRGLVKPSGVADEGTPHKTTVSLAWNLQYDLEFLQTYGCWALTITNNTGADRDFLVVARGI